MLHNRRVCSSDRIPPALGPYSQAIAYGGLLFCSGIVALDPETGQVVEADIATQTRRVLDSLGMLLEDLGSDLSAVLKTTVFLQDMEHFKQFNAIYETYFPSAPPARSAVQVARLPLDVLIEVEAIAAVSDK
jgi:2-iminobutanoate/2-iminopropanoate deaminase